MLRLGCLIAVILIVVVSVLIIKFLPWWGAILAFAGLAVVGFVLVPKLISRGISRIGMGLFETKSKVLRDAQVTIHATQWTEKPDRSSIEDDDEYYEEEDDSSLRFLLVEATITPKPGQSEMQHYEPLEMMLVPFDKPVGPESFGNDSDEADNGVQASMPCTSTKTAAPPMNTTRSRAATASAWCSGCPSR